MQINKIDKLNKMSNASPETHAKCVNAQCINARMHKFTNAQMHKRTTTQPHAQPNTQPHNQTNNRKCMHKQTNRCPIHPSKQQDGYSNIPSYRNPRPPSSCGDEMPMSNSTPAGSTPSGFSSRAMSPNQRWWMVKRGSAAINSRPTSMASPSTSKAWRRPCVH